jgi:hypothetical protein
MMRDRLASLDREGSGFHAERLQRTLIFGSGLDK